MKEIRFVLLLLTLFASGASALELPQTSNVPGGVAVIPLTLAGQAMPRAEFRGKQVMVIRDNNRWIAVVGLPLRLSPGDYQLETTADGKKSYYPIAVVDKKYPVQRLTIKNKRKVYPNKEDL